jgi:hypothetical protein
VFDTEEAPVLLPAPVEGYLPVYARAKVHSDHHIQVGKALYSVPGDLIGRHVDVRADRRLVKVFYAGQLIKCHGRTKIGGRVTDPADLPSEKTDYAMRDIESQKTKARRRGQQSASSSRPCWRARCRGRGCVSSTLCSVPVTATSPNPLSTGSAPPPTNSSSTARATATANAPPSPPPTDCRALPLTPASPVGEHHQADLTTLTSGPMYLARARSLAAGGRHSWPSIPTSSGATRNAPVPR